MPPANSTFCNCSESAWIVQTATIQHPKLATLLPLFAVVLLVALSSGCAALATLPVSSLVGSPNSAALEIHNNTDTRLQEKNFIVIKTNVIGQASGFSLLGILTIVPARFNKAMSRFYEHAEMKPGRPQTVVNLIMEQDSLNFILFSLPRTSISADVIEFIPVAATDSQLRPPPEPPNPSLSSVPCAGLSRPLSE
jgi:hypothetical protein